ncbi:hypothetical protein NGRA_2298 [Nosema granulosis]|uniref:Uncharacterized protein n=1 Tax=Nosema granulosis TaxID=83296 RepID=A0A9P6GWY2_9MICR|nr:hypothetical protein NGRA_2298 [Nosema granulosis]
MMTSIFSSIIICCHCSGTRLINLATIDRRPRTREELPKYEDLIREDINNLPSYDQAIKLPSLNIQINIENENKSVDGQINKINILKHPVILRILMSVVLLSFLLLLAYVEYLVSGK